MMLYVCPRLYSSPPEKNPSSNGETDLVIIFALLYQNCFCTVQIS